MLYTNGTYSGPRVAGAISDTVQVDETFSASSPSVSKYERRKAGDGGVERVQRVEELRFTVTDNPGLVPLSSLNVGLGHAFLRHIERCAALVYVVDLSSEDPIASLEALRLELREYARMNNLDRNLEARIRGVVANKADMFGEATEEMDLIDSDPSRRSTPEEGQRKLAKLTAWVKEMEAREIEDGIRAPEDAIWVVPTSAKNRQNVSALVQKLAATVRIERQRTLELIAEEERELAEEREDAVDRLAAARAE